MTTPDKGHCEFDLEDIRINFVEERRRFPVTERYAYLNHASRGPLSPPAFAVIERVAREMLLVHPDQQAEMARDFRDARRSMADLIGAPEGSTAFVPNDSAGLAMAAGSLPLRAGDNVICARGEFPANIYPWLNLTRRDIEVRFIEPGPAGVTPDQVREIMDSRTRILALSWVNFSNGARIDTAALGSLCAERGISFVVDAIQGVGALQLDLAGIDILVCGGGKWTLSPQGGGFIYIRPDLIANLQPDHVGWLSMAAHADLERFDDLTQYSFDLAQDARRVETGSNALLAQLAMGASCTYLHGLNIARIETRIVQLCDYLIEGLQRKGIPVTAPVAGGLRSGVVCFAADDPAVTVRQLIERDVIVSLREGNIRVGIHFYNNEEDVDRLLDAL